MNLGITPNFNTNQSQANKNQKNQHFGSARFTRAVFENTPTLSCKPTVNYLLDTYKDKIPANIAKSIKKLLGEDVVVLSEQEDGMASAMLNSYRSGKTGGDELKRYAKEAKPVSSADLETYEIFTKSNIEEQEHLKARLSDLEVEQHLINEYLGI